ELSAYRSSLLRHPPGSQRGPKLVALGRTVTAMQGQLESTMAALERAKNTADDRGVKTIDVGIRRSSRVVIQLRQWFDDLTLFDSTVPGAALEATPEQTTEEEDLGEEDVEVEAEPTVPSAPTDVEEETGEPPGEAAGAPEEVGELAPEDESGGNDSEAEATAEAPSAPRWVSWSRPDGDELSERGLRSPRWQSMSPSSTLLRSEMLDASPVVRSWSAGSCAVPSVDWTSVAPVDAVRVLDPPHVGVGKVGLMREHRLASTKVLHRSLRDPMLRSIRPAAHFEDR
ncbi:MAG: hypothetical protein KC431_21635, partial [Myxococcales bacterium]|nr:hypothetical protein [Myxococcales bacterium]